MSALLQVLFAIEIQRGKDLVPPGLEPLALLPRSSKLLSAPPAPPRILVSQIGVEQERQALAPGILHTQLRELPPMLPASPLPSSSVANVELVPPAHLPLHPSP